MKKLLIILLLLSSTIIKAQTTYSVKYTKVSVYETDVNTGKFTPSTSFDEVNWVSYDYDNHRMNIGGKNFDIAKETVVENKDKCYYSSGDSVKVCYIGKLVYIYNRLDNEEYKQCIVLKN